MSYYAVLLLFPRDTVNRMSNSVPNATCFMYTINSTLIDCGIYSIDETKTTQRICQFCVGLIYVKSKITCKLLFDGFIGVMGPF